MPEEDIWKAKEGCYVACIPCDNCGCLLSGVEEKVCTCHLTHSGVCKGKCGCVKCHDEYADFLSSE